MATSQVAFGLTDLFDGKIHSHAGENPNLPAENVSEQLPSKVFEGGAFDVSADNKWIDIDEGSGEVSVALTIGTYTGSALIGHIVSALNAAGGLAETYTGSWTTGTFALGATANFSILWNTGTNTASSIGNEIGFDTSADDTGADNYTADEDRYSTHTFVVFDLGAATAVDAVLLYLETDDDANADFSDVKIYAHTADAGDTRYVWENAVLVTEWEASTRPTSGYNRIQVAHPTIGKVTKRWWCLSWRHFNAIEFHRVGLCKAFEMDTPSGSVQVSALGDHLALDRSEHRSIENQYPAAFMGTWQTTLDCRRWPLDDYEDVLLPLVEHGKKTPFLWALRWDQNKDATHAANEDIRIGFILWATVADFGALRFDGRKSEFASCAVRIEQVR